MAGKITETERRTARLAEALRDNLAKRKAQTRGRKPAAPVRPSAAGAADGDSAMAATPDAQKPQDD